MDLTKWLFQWSLALGGKYFYNRFAKDTKQAGDINREVLKEILTTNARTVYGSRYEFAGIENPKQYKQKVPLTNYADYEAYIERIAKGEENVLTSEPVKYFGLSSGTTGKQKLIPTTKKGQRMITMSMMFLQQGLLFEALPKARTGGKGCLLMNLVQTGTTTAGIPTGSATSGGARSMQKMMPHFWTSPLEVLQIKDQMTANYLHLLFALQDRNLAYIGAPFPSLIVQLFGVLEENWPELVADLKRGTISAKLEIDPGIRDTLQRKLRPQPQRAGELQSEFIKGLRGIAPRVWPRMTYVSCVIGGSFNIYHDRLRYYIGGLPVYSAIYGATESLIGVATKLDDATYAITPRQAYYEFIPVEEADECHPTAYDLDELEVGKLYEIVLTNFSGFYRYRIGDVIQVVGRYNQAPVIEFMYRKGQLLNLAGEKTPELAVQHAIQSAITACGAEVKDYTTHLDLSDTVGCYRVYIEVHKLDGVKFKVQEVRDVLEDCLAEANPSYHNALRSKRIAPLALKLVKRGTFEDLRYELIKRGASNNQVKIPRLVKDEKLLSLLEENIV